MTGGPGRRQMKTTTRARLGAVVAMLFYVACSGGDTGRSPGGGRDDGPFGGSHEPTERVTRALTALRPNIAPPAPLPSEGVVAPSGTGSVGLDGAFNYTIPIEVPPGRAGMQPSLALVYSSRRGNGPLGVGWELAGTSAISRCDKIPASGGVRNRIRFIPTTVQAAYCLDGQRLVFVAGSESQVGAEYRTEVESFTRIKVTEATSGQPVKWRVEFKDGRIATYQKLRPPPPSGEMTFKWADRIVRDAKGAAPNGGQEVNWYGRSYGWSTAPATA